MTVELSQVYGLTCIVSLCRNFKSLVHDIRIVSSFLLKITLFLALRTAAAGMIASAPSFLYLTKNAYHYRFWVRKVSPNPVKWRFQIRPLLWVHNLVRRVGMIQGVVVI